MFVVRIVVIVGVRNDFLLLVANSKLYYKKGSGEFNDACLLESLVIRTIDSVMAGEDPNQTIASAVERMRQATCCNRHRVGEKDPWKREG